MRCGRLFIWSVMVVFICNFDCHHIDTVNYWRQVSIGYSEQKNYSRISMSLLLIYSYLKIVILSYSRLNIISIKNILFKYQRITYRQTCNWMDDIGRGKIKWWCNHAHLRNAYNNLSTDMFLEAITLIQLCCNDSCCYCCSSNVDFAIKRNIFCCAS